MLLALAYAVVRWLSDVLLPRAAANRAQAIELLALRHELRVLRAYAEHYNRARPHRSLRLQAPLAPASVVLRRDRLGGQIHEYEAAA